MSDEPESTVPTATDFAAAYELVNLDPPTLSRREVETESGISRDQGLRWWRAMGFAEVAEDEPAFRGDDVEMVRQLGTLVEAGAIDDSDVLRLARLMGASFSRLVDAQLDALDAVLAPAVDEARGNSASIKRGARIAELVDTDVDVFGFMETAMIYVWRRHLLAAMGHRLTMHDNDDGQAVAFADLSGFSRLSKQAGSEELTEIIETFETAAFDVISEHGGRVVKLIGDEVLFVTGELDDAVSIAIELISRLESVDAMPPVHCGIAFGPTITVGGDVFGPTVNLASRLTTIARPGSIAIPREVGAHLLDRDDLDVRRVRRSYDLKGIGRTSVVVVRPLPNARDQKDDPQPTLQEVAD